MDSRLAGMDARIAVIDAKHRRVKAATAGALIAIPVYFLLLVIGLRQLGTPLPEWANLFFVPLPVLTIGLVVLRSWGNKLYGDATLAQVQRAYEGIEEFEREQKQQRRTPLDE